MFQKIFHGVRGWSGPENHLMTLMQLHPRLQSSQSSIRHQHFVMYHHHHYNNIITINNGNNETIKKYKHGVLHSSQSYYFNVRSAAETQVQGPACGFEKATRSVSSKSPSVRQIAEGDAPGSEGNDIRSRTREPSSIPPSTTAPEADVCCTLRELHLLVQRKLASMATSGGLNISPWELVISKSHKFT